MGQYTRPDCTLGIALGLFPLLTQRWLAGALDGHDGGRGKQRRHVRHRAAPPSALSSRPTSKVGMRPNRAINIEHGTAEIANSIGGRLDSQPICISDRCRSACNRGMTGGVANTVSRRHAPDSQSRRRTGAG
jgi:hypothetical protein